MIQVDKWFFKIGNAAVTFLESLKLEPPLPSDKIGLTSRVKAGKFLRHRETSQGSDLARVGHE